MRSIRTVRIQQRQHTWYIVTALHCFNLAAKPFVPCPAPQVLPQEFDCGRLAISEGTEHIAAPAACDVRLDRPVTTLSVLRESGHLVPAIRQRACGADYLL